MKSYKIKQTWSVSGKTDFGNTIEEKVKAVNIAEAVAEFQALKPGVTINNAYRVGKGGRRPS